MNTNTEMPATTPPSKPHKFFERYLDHDLSSLSDYFQRQYKHIENAEIPLGPKWDVEHFPESNSVTTSEWYRFNAFQFYIPEMHNLLRAVKSMTLEACEYYGINFDDQYYYTQAWFNINYSNKGKLSWHDHGKGHAPQFHGYYCVNAEPSVTHYKVHGNYVDNVNKNNRAILSEIGHEHAMGDWEWDGPRITVAYDVLPGPALGAGVIEQHWIPLV
jgi:hypothetical protein